MDTDRLTRSTLNADVLLWQGKVRLGVALFAGVAEFLLLRTTHGDRPVATLVVAVVAYATVIGALLVLFSRTRLAPEWTVTATVLADIAFVFALTILVSEPGYYDRILIFAFFSLYLTESHFGRAQTVIVLTAVVLGYLVTITQVISSGARVVWPEELWSLGVFLTVVAVFLLQFRHLNRRLANITRLMERGADEGEFSIPYDEEADLRPDAATQVGRAYNRVRAQMSSMVSTDPLTTCVNRRGFEQALAREMSRASRSGSEFSLLALDLDFFKTVNDTRGHLVGDAVLREVGAVLLQSGRGADIVARTGGEEFSVILPDTDGRGAHLVATRLCEKLRGHSFTGGSHPVRLTVSVGVVTKGVDMPENDVEEMKRRADDALYFAKRSGRDCVRVWTSSLIERRSGGAPGDHQRRTRGG